MSRIIPLGCPRYRGKSDVVLARQFQGDLTAGVAVSMVDISASQPVVKLFDGSKFSGFSVHDLCEMRKTLSVIKKGESVCLQLQEGESVGVGEAFAVSNTTGKVVAANASDSTLIAGDIAEIGVIGLDPLSHEIAGCVLVNLYGGVAPLLPSVGTGIAEAPNDGESYVRKNAGWICETKGIEDAPNDGVSYVRQDGVWVEERVAGVEDAPSDGTPYVRQDADWVPEIIPEQLTKSASPTKPTLRNTKK